MPDDLTIRTATVPDAETIAAFNQAMARETEDKALDTPTVEAGVQALIASPEDGFYLLAERDALIVGSLMITTEWSDWRNGRFWWVQSVYVRPEVRRAGIYRALYTDVKRRAAAAEDVCGLRLYVEKENRVARTAYEALGMTQTSYRLYEEMLDRGSQ